MKAWAATLLAALLSACAAQQWTKPGMDPNQFTADLNECARHAQRDAWNIWGYASGYTDAYGKWHDPYAERHAEEYRQNYFCMTQRGYRLSTVQP